MTIDALVVTQGDSFNINNGTSLVVINSGAGTGTIVNSGAIRLNAGQFNPAFLRISGDVTLSGGGTITMTDTTPSVNSNNAAIFGSATTDRLTNVDNTISGGGSFGGGQMVFTNRGTIIATNPDKKLLINPTIRSTGNINTGVLRANGGILSFQIHTIDNAGGTIEALDGSVVELRSQIFNGGTLQTTGTGVIRTANAATFANLTTKGNIQIPGSSSLTLMGNIVNNGTIAINEIGDGAASLLISGDVNLSGGGTVTLADKMSAGSLLSAIRGSAATDRLTNADNTIIGAGAIGDGQMLLTNNATIVARGTNRLVIGLSAGSNVNTSSLRADGGTLVLFLSSFTNTGGTIEARANSRAELISTTVTGGTLNTVGTGVIATAGFRGGSVTVNNLTNTGNIVVSSGSSLTPVGTLTNRGTIAVNGGSNGAASLLISESVTLNGGGTVTLADEARSGSLLSGINGTTATARLINVDNTISGAGSISGLVFDNRATVVAKGTNQLVIQQGFPSFNTGTLRADGGTLVLDGSSFTNTGGTIEARNASRAELLRTTINGGTLNTVGTGVVATAGFRTQVNATLNNLTNTGNIVVPSNSSLILVGNIVNKGTIAINEIGDGAASLRISESVTLNGGGTVTLADEARSGSLLSSINGTDATARLINVDNTISGAGAVQGVTLINNGTILVAGQNPLLFLSPLTNNGTLRVDAGNTLRINTGLTLTQAAGVLVVNGTFDSIINGPGIVAVTGGTLAGTGTIANNVTNSGGTVSPGNFASPNVSSVGALTVNGNYTQGADGTLFIQINGSAPGSGFDQLLTTRTANFAGKLDVTSDGGFAPAGDSQFQVVTYGSRAGQGRMTLNVLNSGNRGGFTQIYNPKDLTLVAQGTPTIGVNLQPTQVFTNTVLTATIITAPSTPVNSVTYDFRVNGVSKQNGTSNTFNLGVAGQGDKNDVITVIAQTDDDRRNQNSVTVQNTKPVAQNPADRSARGGELISIPLSGSDLDGDALTFRIITGARNGSASIRKLANGSSVLDYTARALFNGSENIVFIANDGQSNSALARLTINVTSPIPPPTNRAPVAFSQTASTNAGQAADIAVSPSDPDAGDTLDTFFFRVTQQPASGTVPSISLVNGSVIFRYVPNPGFSGVDSFKYVVTDKRGTGLTSNEATISIRVIAPPTNRAPVAFSGGITLLNASAGQEVNSFLSAIDPDPEDTIDTLFFRITQQPTSGTIADISLVDGQVAFRYVPNPGFFGVDSFKYVAVDKANTGLISNEATYSIRIIAPPINRAPVAFSETVSTNAGQTVNIGVSPSDSNPEDTLDTLFFRVTQQPANGTVPSVSLVGDNNTGIVVFRYVPRAGFSGVDSFKYVVIDKKGTGLTSNEATVSIRVIAPIVNRAPVAFSTAVNVRRGQLNFQVDLPLNAIDPDGDEITFRIVNDPSFGGGQILFAADGRAFYRYVDFQGRLAPDSVTFVATDSKGAQSNEATISILNVNDTPVNRAPVAFSSGTAMSLRNGIVDILASGIDPDAEDTIDTLTFKIVQGPTRGRVREIVRRDGRVYFRFVPNFFQNPLPSNTDVIKFVIVDKNGTGLQSNTATISLTISDAPIKPPPPGPNRAPVITQPPPTVAAPFATQVSFLINAFDPDGDDFEYVILQRTNNGVGNFDSSGYFVYTNSDVNRASDTIRFVAIDDKGARSNEVTLVIARPAPNQPNQAPSVANSSASTVVGVPIDIPITAFDRDGDRLQFAFPNNATRSANGGTVEFIGSTGGPMLRYIPAPNFVGVDSVSFRVRDGKPITGPEAIGLVTITVNYPTSARRAPANKEVKSPSSGNS